MSAENNSFETNSLGQILPLRIAIEVPFTTTNGWKFTIGNDIQDNDVIKVYRNGELPSFEASAANTLVEYELIIKEIKEIKETNPYKMRNYFIFLLNLLTVLHEFDSTLLLVKIKEARSNIRYAKFINEDKCKVNQLIHIYISLLYQTSLLIH
jgi:hypothetical protein